MKLVSASDALCGNPYPGRGIILGRSDCGRFAVAAYFIMGRSTNSRNRIFAPTEDGIQTKAHNPALLTDPTLIIYHPVRILNNVAIITNGDQTDTVADFLRQGETFETALETRSFEPDAPNYTPRISGLLNLVEPFSFQLSILKTQNGNAESPCRYFFRYADPAPGTGRLIHTYQGDGEPLPSFEGEPRSVSITGTQDEFTNSLWESLNEENRVSLYTAFFPLSGGKPEVRIINKNK